MLDLETCSMLADLYYDSKKSSSGIIPHIYQKRLSLNIMMTFCYGTRFDNIDDPLMLQIINDASTIAR